MYLSALFDCLCAGQHQPSASTVGTGNSWCSRGNFGPFPSRNSGQRLTTNPAGWREFWQRPAIPGLPLLQQVS